MALPRVWGSFSRTACFGSCPVFEVYLYNDSTAWWCGERHVKRLGEWTSRLPRPWIDSIQQQVEKMAFFSLKPQYPKDAPLLNDLPLTVMFFHWGKHENRVIDNADSPRAVQAFEKWFQEKLEELPWQAEQKAP